MDNKNKKTNMVMKVNSELWDQFLGLAKFLKKDRNELLESAIKDRIEKEKNGKDKR